ncbi:hypothetical protein LZ659_08525 [Shewanella indica]|uniref:Lipoprotein SmpA/OmlA domain-containing protein n=1 Tax=Shewanella indica TaxID=768528 RepID=A0ABU4Q7Z9_9GAMM|nr:MULTISPECIES: hypothetical protein [Shewanella]MCE9791639.1 hypothetical protein [Shewanella indica]MDX6014976.1 hypothetical protein [Shewanella indica]
MKIIGIFTALITLSACTYTSNMNVGTNFSSEQVAKIAKGKTAEADLVNLFGQPQVKAVINETDVKWIYSYTEGSASAQAFTMKTTSDFTTHTLDILLRNGVVVNFAETHAPTNMTINTQSSIK